MLLKRFYDTKLAQASYLIGCSATGEALVVDANRDVEQYLRAAGEEGLRVTHVTETHIHADFVSGSRELASRAGAALLLSDEGGTDWRYAFASEAGAILLHDGDRFTVGNLRFEVLHTPGHTPEHLSFLLTDTPATDQPMGVVTGDFVFVGDVGRPDLLEKTARMTGTMEGAARTLFRSLQRFRQLPDHLQIWPGHGAGSACGKALGAVPSSTLGYEKLANWAFAVAGEDAFAAAVLEGQPEPPRYFAEMKRINREGPRILHGFHRPDRLPASRLEGLLRDGTMIVDARRAPEFAARHLPGTISIPLNKSFNTWAGWLVPYDRDFHLIVEEENVDEAVRDLAMIGLDAAAGWFDPSAIDSWVAQGGDASMTPQIGPTELAERMRKGEVTVIDVRGRAEWEAGHLPGVENIPVGLLSERLGDLPKDRPVVLQCQGGGRSAIAASVLRAAGVDEVINLAGGYSAWRAAGLPVEG